MTEKTIYIAFDGKEFEDYSECERYESKELQNKYGKDLLVYDDENNELIPISDDYCLSQESAYVICKTKEALNYLNNVLKDNNCKQINYYGKFPVSFYYDFEVDGFRELEPRIKELQAVIDMFSKYIVKGIKI